ncbi:hypothetical protein SSOG_02981 [Streptomyces himastatinicus ATCC 53653]|uniref:Uncharacterized protein n=1 Tax=Streptomyces himastatinicus ATCC 53653 TaxID=457427 RepID=D9WG51_9ACTN|nr:hypothetical protein [Streptomyces himastatinicus]EFL23267.1 hypothetical protein SSOG_02981 [Streptomyces himastatinicus ATCC 53653]
MGPADDALGSADAADHAAQWALATRQGLLPPRVVTSTELLGPADALSPVDPADPASPTRRTVPSRWAPTTPS